MATALIILGAGMGTRMNSELPKVLHHIAGAPMLVHAMKAGAALEPAHTVIVAGHGAEAVTKAAQAHDPDAVIALQTEQLGTAHAVAQAREALAGFSGKVIVLYGDTPFIRPMAAAAMAALFGLGHVDADGATVEVGTVEGGNGLIGRFVVLKGDKAETTRAARVAIADHDCFAHFAVGRKRSAQTLVVRVPAQTSNKQFLLTLNCVEIAMKKGYQKMPIRKPLKGFYNL